MTERTSRGVFDRLSWTMMRVVASVAVGGFVALTFHGMLGRAYGLAMFPFATLLTFMRLRDPQP